MCAQREDQVRHSCYGGYTTYYYYLLLLLILLLTTAYYLLLLTTYYYCLLLLLLLLLQLLLLAVQGATSRGQGPEEADELLSGALHECVHTCCLLVFPLLISVGPHDPNHPNHANNPNHLNPTLALSHHSCQT